MIRIYKYSNTDEYKDFENHLFTNTEAHDITFDFGNDKVIIDEEDYRISTINIDINTVIQLKQNIKAEPEKITVSESGSISDFKSITLITSSEFEGTILNDTANADSVYNFSYDNGITEISYTITSGTIEILLIK